MGGFYAILVSGKTAGICGCVKRGRSMGERRFVILAADDEVELLDALQLFLEKENMELIKTADGISALGLFEKRRPDLVLLDVMMPGMDGFAVLRKIREKSKVPALMMTARTEDYDKILGLELGADDYITKPYNPLEVVARIKAQLRRSYDYQEKGEEDIEILKGCGLELNLAEGTLKKGGKEISLTKTEFKILQLLMKTPGRIYTKRQIFDHSWEETYVGDDSVVMVHISNLRNKIEDDPKKPAVIRTVKGLGYKFERKENR